MLRGAEWAAGQRGSRLNRDERHGTTGVLWLPRRPAAPLPRLRNSEKLMCLEAQPPARMCKAVAEGGLGVCLKVRSVHGLKEEMRKREGFESLRLRTRLGEDELDLVSAPYLQLGARLWTYADPVYLGQAGQGAIGLDRYLEVSRVKGIHEAAVELQERLTPRANHERTSRFCLRPRASHGFG